MKGAGNARAEDFCHGVNEIADWLNSRTPAPVPRLIRTQRIGRGTSNNVTGYLLCPLDIDWNNFQYAFHLIFARTIFHMTFTELV